MRKLEKLLMLAVLSFTVQAQDSIQIKHSLIKKLNPKITDSKVQALTQFATKVEAETGLSWKLAIAIIFQESSFLTDPNKCLKIKRVCKYDLGIAQINWQVWRRVFPELDRLRLARDYKYSLDYSLKILKHLNTRHYRDPEWYSRYHSFTPSLRKVYNERLNAHYVKIRDIYVSMRYGYKQERQLFNRTDRYWWEGLHTGCIVRSIYNVQRRFVAIR